MRVPVLDSLRSTGSSGPSDSATETRFSSRRAHEHAAPALAVEALAVVDLFIVALAFGLAYGVHFEVARGWVEGAVLPPVEVYVKFAMLMVASVALLARLQHLYAVDFHRSHLEESREIAKVVSIAVCFGLATTSIYPELGYSRAIFAYFWFFAIAGLAVVHAGFASWRVRRHARGLDRTRTLVVGQPTSYFLRRLQSDPVFGVDLVGWLGHGESRSLDDEHAAAYGGGALMSSAQGEQGDVLPAIPYLGTIADLAAIIPGIDVEQIVVVDQTLSHRQLLEILDACDQYDIHARLIPPVYDLRVEPADVVLVDGVPLLWLDEGRSEVGRDLVKRVFDVVVASSLLVLLSPLFFAIALAIRLSSPGKVVFKQLRAGKSGRPFEMLKFRTMDCDAESRLSDLLDLDRLPEPVFKLARDPRVTPVGRCLRRFSLDELPQLINVLRGEMTIVGPRPEELRMVERYDPWHRRRLRIKPGITGLQQVVARGSLSNLNDRVRLDVYYTRQRSLAFDLVILARTIVVVLTGRGAT